MSGFWNVYRRLLAEGSERGGAKIIKFSTDLEGRRALNYCEQETITSSVTPVQDGWTLIPGLGICPNDA